MTSEPERRFHAAMVAGAAQLKQEIGYNPTKPGRPSFHPLLAVGAGTRLCVAYRFRRGDTVTATQWQAAMTDAQDWLGDRQPWLNRGDLGLGHEAIMAWHEATRTRPKYLFKLKLTANVRRRRTPTGS